LVTTTAIVLWTSIAAALWTALGLLAATISIAHGDPPVVVAAGAAPFAITMATVVIAMPWTATGTLRAHGLIRLWVRQIRHVASSPTPRSAVTHGHDVGHFVRVITRQIERHIA
jgi:hypothetical protein